MVQNFKFHKFNSEMKHLQCAIFLLTEEVHFTKVISVQTIKLLNLMVICHS